MPRIQGVDPETTDGQIREVFAAQTERWGAPLENHRLYARRPSIFQGVRAMWDGLGASGRMEPPLQALINRRVAALNGCMF
jgi:alkylhydroperoxidase family enzyme